MEKVILKFWSHGCVNCKAMEPFIIQLRIAYSDIAVRDIDTNTNEDLVKQYDIQSLPTLVFLLDGKEVGKLVGLKPKSLIEKKIAEVYS